MENIKKSIKEIVENRYKEKCYLIYDNEGDFFVIYGSMWRTIENGWLYDALISFVKGGEVKWPFYEKRIILDRDQSPREWKYLNKEVEDKVIHIDELFIDGEKKN